MACDEPSGADLAYVGGRMYCGDGDGAEGERDSRGGGIGGGVSCGDNALSAAAVTGDGARDSRTAGGDSVMASGSVRPNGIEDAEAFGGSRGERLVAGGTGDGVAL